MKHTEWRTAEEVKEFKKLQPGGYICRIVAVEDVPDKEYLKIKYDIAYGDYMDYYKGLYDRFGNWGGVFIKSYKDKALPFFKGFLTAVEESNRNYVFNDDERTLVGKLVGLVLGEEEYLKQNGDVGKRFYVNAVRSMETIKNNDFVIPELKKYSGVVNSFVPMDNNDTDDDLPF